MCHLDRSEPASGAERPLDMDHVTRLRPPQIEIHVERFLDYAPSGRFARNDKKGKRLGERFFAPTTQKQIYGLVFCRPFGALLFLPLSGGSRPRLCTGGPSGLMRATSSPLYPLVFSSCDGATWQSRPISADSLSPVRALHWGWSRGAHRDSR